MGFTNNWQQFYFNESGYYVGVASGTFISDELEYVHANMGWGYDTDIWMDRGVYTNWYNGHDYSGYLYFIPGIEPK